MLRIRNLNKLVKAARQKVFEKHKVKAKAEVCNYEKMEDEVNNI